MSVARGPFRPGTSGDAVVDALQRAAAEASNARSNVSGPGMEPIERYVAWTESVVMLLENVLQAQDASELVHSPAYWALRYSTGELVRPIAAITQELDRAHRRLQAVADEVRQEQRRFSGAGALVVPDTNIFIDAFREDEASIEDIDWHAAAQTRSDVRLVVPIVVVHELDRLKRQGNNTARKGAQRALRWLAQWLPRSPEQRSGKFASGQPTTSVEVYVHERTSGDADGEIIAAAARLAVWSDVKLVTYDLGMRIRASAAGVDAEKLADPD